MHIYIILYQILFLNINYAFIESFPQITKFQQYIYIYNLVWKDLHFKSMLTYLQYVNMVIRCANVIWIFFLLGRLEHLYLNDVWLGVDPRIYNIF